MCFPNQFKSDLNIINRKHPKHKKEVNANVQRRTSAGKVGTTLRP
jgi:hypothetical protein